MSSFCHVQYWLMAFRASRNLLSAGVLLLHPLPIRAAGDVSCPLVVLKVPEDGLADATLERLSRMPLQFVLDLAGIDRVTAIVPWPVGHECDQFPVGQDWIFRAKFIEQLTDGLDNFDVGLFVPARRCCKLTRLGPAPAQCAMRRNGRPRTASPARSAHPRRWAKLFRCAHSG